MPKGFSIQNSFSAGEISPLAYGRTDSDLYRSGCEELENMISDSHGPARSRKGFELIGYNVALQDAVVMTTQVTANLPYTFVFGVIIKMFSPEGEVWVDNLIGNPRFHDNDAGWTINQLGFDSIISIEKDSLIITTGRTLTEIGYEIATPTATVENYRLRIHMENNGQKYRVKVGRNLAGVDVLDVITTDELFEYEFPSTPVWPSDPIFVAVIFGADSRGTDEGTFKLHYVELIQDTGVGATIPYSFIHPYETYELAALRFIQSPDGTAIYVLHASHAVQKITYNKSTGVWAFIAVTFTAPPSEWATGNYPTVGTIYENRLWLGATRDEQSTMWASKSNLLEDFTTGINDDDSFNFTLQSVDQIMWALATKDLVLGAAHSEIIVTSAGGVVTQSDIQLQQQSSYGSAPQQPLLLGDQIIYISLDRRKLRVIQYEFRADNWLSTDLTFPSEHITEGDIIELAWQQDPDNLLWINLRDGTLACLTYDRSNEIYGWHRHSSDGEVLSITAGDHIGQSILSVITRRGLNPTSNLPVINLESLSHNQYIDSWAEVSDEVAATSFGGFDHLEGKTVRVLADDAARIDAGGPSELVWQSDVVVDGFGNVTTDNLAYRVVAGLAYSAKFKSLPFDAGSVGGGNTGRTHNKRWNKLFVEVNESARPIINGSRPPARTAPTPMDTTEGLKTEIIQVSLLGINKEAQITIEQDLPFPLTIVSIFGEIAQDNL